MKALIVGGAGFVGSNLVRACLAEGMTVTVADSFEARLGTTRDGLRDVASRITIEAIDMRDPALETIVAGQDVIFNCAGQTSHPISMKEPVFDAELNCGGHLAFLETVRRAAPQATIVYTSTSTVIGKATAPVIDESHLERPLDIYSANKLAAEKYYRIYHTAHGLKTIVLRFANLFGGYGRTSSDFGFVNYFIHVAWQRGEIKIFGAGQQMRNLLYVEDACAAMISAARELTVYGEPFFAAHHAHVSVRDIAHQIIESLGRGRVTHMEWPAERKRIEVDDVQISSARFQQHVAWQPRFELREGLARTRHILEAT